MINKLQQRLFFFLLLPVALLLFLAGFLGFIFARNNMLDQWREAATLKLQRAAHHIDMRLNQRIFWIEMFQKTGDLHHEGSYQEWILERIRELDGVVNVNLVRVPGVQSRGMDRGMHMGRRSMMGSHGGSIAEVTPPMYDAEVGAKTVSLISYLEDENDRIVGNLLITILFDYLMQDIKELGWWQSDIACLIDKSGKYLAHTEAMMKTRKRLGETDDPLELAVLKENETKPFGTILGSGHPPNQVAGFYKITKAPWTIVLLAQGDKILAPIVKFLFYYVVAGILCVLLILLLIRFVVGNMVRSIKEISVAAEGVANGNYDSDISIRRHDEIGQLGMSFNTMVQGLKERDFISNTFGRYVDQEIAKELMNKPEAARLGGQKREVAILMSDIRNFTPLSENLSPEQIIGILNRYFSYLIDIITKYKGIIVDFFGDSVLVFFDPLEGPVKPVVANAIDCGLEMQGTMKKFNEEMSEENSPELQMGIGINAGEVVVGNIGSETRVKYGIVGSPVNITHRIQSVADGGDIVISESVYKYVKDAVRIKKAFTAPLKGINESTNLYIVEIG
jgi:class 3 adenylate cyclase